MSTLSKKNQNKIETKGYYFSKEGHCHYLDGQRLTGVTTALSVISKGDALIQWAANMAVDYIKEKSEKEFVADDPETKEPIWNGRWEVRDEILEEARKAHQRKKEEAGQSGVNTHTEIEKLIKEAIADDGIIKNWSGGNDIEKDKQIIHFIAWTQLNKVKFLESELHIYSKELFVGGICDFICEIDGEIWIGDIKTGSGIYPEHFWQTAAYQILIEEMGKYPAAKGHIILNLKKDGSFVEKRSVSNEDNKGAFLACLKIYRIKQKVEGNLL